MNNPFDFFDKIYCINLPKSKNRWKAVSKEFEKAKILERIKRIWANPPPPNYILPNMKCSSEFGITMSHLKVIGDALYNANGHVLIFEDDISFLDKIHEKLTELIDNIPNDWDVLYLSGFPANKSTAFYKKTIFKTGFFSGAWSYAINYKSLLRFYLFAIDELMKNDNKVTPSNPGAFDNILGKFAENNNSYAIYPMIKPVPGLSLRLNKFKSYNDLIDKRWKRFCI